MILITPIRLLLHRLLGIDTLDDDDMEGAVINLIKEKLGVKKGGGKKRKSKKRNC